MTLTPRWLSKSGMQVKSDDCKIKKVLKTINVNENELFEERNTFRKQEC